MRREIDSNQRKMRAMGMILAASTTTITGPDALQATLVNTSTGVNTVTLTHAFGSSTQYVVVASCVTAGVYAEVTITSSSVFVISTFTTDGNKTATAAITHVMILGSDVTQQF